MQQKPYRALSRIYFWNLYTDASELKELSHFYLSIIKCWFKTAVHGSTRKGFPGAALADTSGVNSFTILRQSMFDHVLRVKRISLS